FFQNEKVRSHGEAEIDLVPNGNATLRPVGGGHLAFLHFSIRKSENKFLCESAESSDLGSRWYQYLGEAYEYWKVLRGLGGLRHLAARPCWSGDNKR
ncbi:MAG: hypothetical protein V2I43_00500, partial [Parvularcula sp.]|nr:hypothetical protein [Parvularcula sp.]